jgi:hypothetical protein
MRPDGDMAAPSENDPLATVIEPRWVVLTDIGGRVLGGTCLMPPVNERRALMLACQIVSRVGYAVTSVVGQSSLCLAAACPEGARIAGSASIPRGQSQSGAAVLISR